MTSNLMSTEKGGEQTQYEAEHTHTKPHKKSTGQLGSSSEMTTTDPTKTTEHAEQKAERGARTAENVRYGQGISEGGMGGVTTGQEGKADDAEKEEEGGAGAREAAGYGGEREMDRSVGA